MYSAKEVFIRLIGEIRAQEQAKKDARAAPKTPESGEKRKVCRPFTAPPPHGSCLAPSVHAQSWLTLSRVAFVLSCVRAESDLSAQYVVIAQARPDLVADGQQCA